MSPFVVLTGASGSGKTAIVEAIETRRPGFADVFHFDSVGVPPPQAMAAEWGSGEAWQRATTLRWMATIAALPFSVRPRLLEGQMRLAFIRDGLALAGLVGARVVLVDCDDETRTHRLTIGRNQPELANETMMNWAAFLRHEAHDGGHEVLDTTGMSVDDGVERVCALLRQTAS